MNTMASRVVQRDANMVRVSIERPPANEARGIDGKADVGSATINPFAEAWTKVGGTIGVHGEVGRGEV